jgi:hypothetical protein
VHTRLGEYGSVHYSSTVVTTTPPPAPGVTPAGQATANTITISAVRLYAISTRRPRRGIGKRAPTSTSRQGQNNSSSSNSIIITVAGRQPERGLPQQRQEQPPRGRIRRERYATRKGCAKQRQQQCRASSSSSPSSPSAPGSGHRTGKHGQRRTGGGLGQHVQPAAENRIMISVITLILPTTTKSGSTEPTMIVTSSRGTAE